MTMQTQKRYAVYHANDPHAMITPLAEHWYVDRSRHYPGAACSSFPRC